MKLPECIFASSDLLACCENADVIIFAIPHQFLKPLLEKLKGHVKLKGGCVDEMMNVIYRDWLCVCIVCIVCVVCVVCVLYVLCVCVCVNCKYILQDLSSAP